LLIRSIRVKTRDRLTKQGVTRGPRLADIMKQRFSGRVRLGACSRFARRRLWDEQLVVRQARSERKRKNRSGSDLPVSTLKCLSYPSQTMSASTAKWDQNMGRPLSEEGNSGREREELVSNEKSH
jgi:hypothetical protein